jgi:hypothetical protein
MGENPNGYMAVGYFLFLQEQTKGIINKRQALGSATALEPWFRLKSLWL